MTTMLSKPLINTNKSMQLLKLISLQDVKQELDGPHKVCWVLFGLIVINNENE
jgi:hypothetical protein